MQVGYVFKPALALPSEGLIHLAERMDKGNTNFTIPEHLSCAYSNCIATGRSRTLDATPDNTIPHCCSYIKTFHFDNVISFQNQIT